MIRTDEFDEAALRGGLQEIENRLAAVVRGYAQLEPEEWNEIENIILRLMLDAATLDPDDLPHPDGISDLALTLYLRELSATAHGKQTIQQTTSRPCRRLRLRRLATSRLRESSRAKRMLDQIRGLSRHGRLLFSATIACGFFVRNYRGFSGGTPKPSILPSMKARRRSSMQRTRSSKNRSLTALRVSRNRTLSYYFSGTMCAAACENFRQHAYSSRAEHSSRLMSLPSGEQRRRSFTRRKLLPSNSTGSLIASRTR
jgi:hypothetical protein